MSNSNWPLNHVGIAVPDLEEACETFTAPLYGATDITHAVRHAGSGR